MRKVSNKMDKIDVLIKKLEELSEYVPMFRVMNKSEINILMLEAQTDAIIKIMKGKKEKE